MQKDKVIKHYGSPRNVAAVLSISVQSVNQWESRVPKLRALELDRLTRGKLKYRKADYDD